MALSNNNIPELHNEPVINMFDYISKLDFLDLLTQVSESFLVNEKTKNKKEEIIGFWLVINLRVLIAKFYPNHKNRIKVDFLPRITGLLNTTTYEVSMSFDGKVILVIGVKYIIANFGQNFQRNFDDVVVNTVDINNHKGMGYINIMLLHTDTPTFTPGVNKKFEKYEYLSIKHLIKITNLSLLGKSNTYLPTIILGRGVETSNNNLKSSIKQNKIKLADSKFVFQSCLKNGFTELAGTKIQDQIIERDIYRVLHKIINIFSARVFGDKNGIQKD